VLECRSFPLGKPREEEGGIANQREILPTDWKREKKSQKYTSAPQINKIAISTYIHIHYM